MKPIRVWKAVTGASALAMLLTGALSPASAQEQGRGERKPTEVGINVKGDSKNIPLADTMNMIPTEKVPDVHIVVAPYKGKYAVSAVYSMQVPRAVADAHLKALLDKTGWKATDITFEDGKVTSVATDDPSGMSQTMSSISFNTDAPVIDEKGVVTIEPFLIAFRDRNRVNLTFLGKNGVAPTGPRTYDDDNVRLQAPFAPGALTYFADIKNHNFTSLNLPRTDSPDTVAGTTPVAAPTNWPMIFVMTVLAVLAVGVGGITYALTRRTT